MDCDYTVEQIDDMESRETCDVWEFCPPEYENCAECRARANSHDNDEEGEE